MSDTYQIIRFSMDERVPDTFMEGGLSLKEAQTHCRRDDTQGEGWFDGYKAEEPVALDEEGRLMDDEDDVYVLTDKGRALVADFLYKEFDAGYSLGHEEGREEGYEEGYKEGYKDVKLQRPRIDDLDDYLSWP